MRNSQRKTKFVSVLDPVTGNIDINKLEATSSKEKSAKKGGIAAKIVACGNVNASIDDFPALSDSSSTQSKKNRKRHNRNRKSKPSKEQDPKQLLPEKPKELQPEPKSAATDSKQEMTAQAFTPAETHEMQISCDSLSSINSVYTDNDSQTDSQPKSDVETQTDSEDKRSRKDSSSQTDSEKKFSTETQTVDIENTAHVGRNVFRQEIVLEIPEKLVEMIPAKEPVELLQPITELSVLKFGEKFEFNFIGAFLDFDDLEAQEIFQIQEMLVNQHFDVCQRAAYDRLPIVPKFVMTA